MDASPSIRTGNAPRNIAGGLVSRADDDATHGSGNGEPSSCASSSEYDDSEEEYYEDDDELQQQGEAELDVSTSTRIREQDAQRPSRQPRSHRRQPTTRQSSTRAATATAAQRRRQQQQPKPKPPRAHAAVEKRYRSMVNSKIQQLNALIPASNIFTPDGSDEPGASEEPQRGTEELGSQKMPTKSVVLDRGLQYTNHLIATYERYEAEGNELRRKLQQWLDISAVDGEALGTVDRIE